METASTGTEVISTQVVELYCTTLVIETRADGVVLVNGSPVEPVDQTRTNLFSDSEQEAPNVAPRT